MQPRITISITCYGRPERTKRSIQCILDQDINGWEAFIMGDCCPDFQKLIDSGYLQSIKEEQEKKGNIIHFFNAKENGGGCGYKLINHAIQNATGKYFIFYANDDIILNNHFSNYLEIESTDLDYMFFNSWIDPIDKTRVSKLVICEIGHSEIILTTELVPNTVKSPYNTVLPFTDNVPNSVLPLALILLAVTLVNILLTDTKLVVFTVDAEM